MCDLLYRFRLSHKIHMPREEKWFGNRSKQESKHHIADCWIKSSVTVLSLSYLLLFGNYPPTPTPLPACFISHCSWSLQRMENENARPGLISYSVPADCSLMGSRGDGRDLTAKLAISMWGGEWNSWRMNAIYMIQTTNVVQDGTGM